MIETLRARSAPYGGAVLLEVLCPVGSSVRVLASTSATPPTSPTDLSARVVFDGVLERRGVPSGNPARAWFNVLDLGQGELPDDQTLHYYAYPRVSSTAFGPRITTAVQTTSLRATFIPSVRDLVRPRLTYHLRRAVANNLCGAQVQTVQVLEQSTLEKGFPLPVVLLKISTFPNPSQDVIGKAAGGGQLERQADGSTVRVFSHALRVRIDLLLISSTPQERSDVARFLYGTFLSDMALYQHSGLQGLSVQETPRDEVMEETHLFMSEINVDAEMFAEVRDAVDGTVTDTDVGGSGF